ncbi:hypothetical protein LAZ67_16000203, partial [Cordylochernes scorpioides]
MHLGMSSSASPGSSGSAGQEPGRPSIPAPTGGRISSENGNQKILKENSENRVYANPPAGVKDVNLAAARDVTLNLPAGTSSNGAARVLGSWADCIEDLSPGAEDDFTVVKTKKRRRESSNSPTAAAPSSNSGGARSSRRLHSSARSVPRAQEIPTTRTHITEDRARQASSSEEHCVYLEHGPELQPFHYLRALDRLLGGTAGIIQISKVNGHQLLGLANRGLAERLINNGLEVEGTLLRAFPFRKRAERITVSNLPFFVEDSAIINALRPFGRITSIAPKMMKAGPYTYTDGRREAFIVLHEGMTTERLPTRLDITIKGEAWPAYLSTGIKCSRCHGQGHRRANCPLLAGLANNTRTAPPTTPAGVPPPTTPAPPQRSAAQPPAPTPSNPAMEVCSAPPVARAALHSSAPRPSPPAAPAFPMEETPPAPPPVTPAPSLQTPGSREPAAPTPDVEMSIVEETLAYFTSSAKNATRVDLDAFIEGHPSVSFAKTDALGLGREEVLDLLSSRTKAQRKGPLLSPPQCDALVGLIGQILDLRPGAASNLYKVLGQVKAEFRTTPAVPPTPTLPAPWPSKPTPPALHGEKTSPDIATPPPPLSTEFIDACYDQANDIIYELSDERYSEPLSDIGVTEGDIVEAIIFPDDREPLLRRLSTQKRTTLAGIVSAASERARSSDPFMREGLRILSEMLPPPPPPQSLLTGHFCPKPNVIVQRYHFNKRNQGTESVSAYVAELRKLSENCEFIDLDDRLRDRLVCGLRNEFLVKRLLSEKDLTFEKAVNLALCDESASTDASILQEKMPELNVISKLNKFESPKFKPNKVNSNSFKKSVNKLVCIRCKGNHLPKVCKFQNAKCFKCGKIGHLQKACLTKANNLTYLHNKINSFSDPSLNNLKTDDEICPFYITANLDGNEIAMLIDSGLLNYYERFLRNKATVVEPLHRLLDSNNPWKWNREHQRAFKEAKSLISSESVLAHFDDNLPILVSCDASEYGIGAILSQVDHGVERPVVFASRTLNKTERRYAVIDREALAVIFAVSKFYQYLLGRKFKILTDHKPLIGLFNPSKPIPQVLSPRMLRWCLTLSAYSYSIEYKPGRTNGNVDALSRLPLNESPSEVPNPPEVFFIESENAAVSSSEVAKLTNKDPILSRIKFWAMNGWPEQRYEEKFKDFSNRSSEISVHKDCLLWGSRVIIPEKLRRDILNLLHDTHVGIVGTKALARGLCWWPNMDKDIERLVSNCRICLSCSHDPPKTSVYPWIWPSRPWSRLHIDHAGPFQGKLFLVAVDAFSKWTEAKIVKNDNGDWSTRLARSLLTMRITINNTTQKSPAQLLMNRNLKCLLNKCHPEIVSEERNKQEEKFMRTWRPHRAVEEGQEIVARNYHGPKWLPGVVCEKTGPVSVKVETDDGIVINRHLDQVRSCGENESLPSTSSTPQVPPENEETQDAPAIESPAVTPQPVLRRMVETRSGKMQDPAQERIQAEESAKPQPGVTIGRDASSDPVVLNPNIDIPKYDGTEDPRPWIESLEEIGFLYHWADYIISRYAAMNMTGSAKTWLNLHKASFTSWENIKIRLIQDFSLDANKEELRMKLNRMQHWNEPAIRFAEDILVLCNKVDPAMEEETKIEHVIGGLKKEYSFALYLNPPKTTDDLLVVCKKMDYFEKKYRERVEKSRNLYNGPRYSRPQQQSRYVPPTAARNYQTTSRPQAPVSNNYKNDSHPTPRQYRNNFPQPSTPRRPYNPNFVPKPNLQRNTYNKSQEVSKNRTEDGRPICFKCNKPGHVARYCRVKFIRILEEYPADTQEKVEEKCQMNEISEKSGPRLYADIGTFEALVDTGADLSVVDLRTALDTGHGISKLAKICAGPDGKKLDMVGSIFLNIKIDDETLSHNFVILKTHLRTLILGRDFLKKMNAKIDCKQETIKYDLTNNHDEINFEMLKIKSAKDSIVPECSMKLIKALVETEDGEYIIEESSKIFQTNGLRLARSLINVINRETHIWITNPYPRPLKIMKNQTLAFGSSPAKINVSREREVEKNEEPRFQINENLSPKEQKELKQVLERYGDLFSSRLGRTNLAKHRIDTEDAKPIKHKPYRVSAKERDIIKEQIDEMLTEGIIRPSSSPWSFPVILVKKRDGKYRFCVDYRKLNNVTVKDVYPIPRIDEVMDTLQGSTHFSAIDLRSGYWQVEVEERDKEKTAFTTAHGLYEFNVMPFGLCNAPATFERNMENMLGNLRWQICLCYLDDVIIYSPDFPTHLKRLEAVFRCFRESNLRLNDKKCRFAFEELEILGYITSKHGIKPAEHNIKAVRNFPRPKKVKEVQSFLGMCSYYRKFIKDFSKIADPLTNLIKKSVSFTWTERQEEAFQTLKTALLSPPILGHFNPNAPTYVHTDASNIGIGATLVQDIGGEEKVISYLSRTLSKAEQNYSTTEKECLAVVWSMSKLRPYLYGRHFKIVTDHHALCWLKNLKDPTGRLARWALKIQEYDFDIIHKSGKKHLDADGLSRGPLPETDWDEDFERLFLNQITDEEDKFIESVKKNLNGSRRSIAQNFKEEDGCLFKKNPNPEGRAWLLVVPENKKREIMKEYHNHMSNGHLGVARTMYRIKSKYFWPSMLKDVSEFVRTCHLCQSRKGSNQLPSGLLQPIPPANFPFERIGIDFVGPLPSTKNRKKWIIVLSDYYTRYAETRAVSEATVKEVSKFLVEDIFLRHGAPQYLISDRGSQFTSNLMKEVMKTCKIKHCFTTSYHPQTNGLTERLNRTLINMLSMYVNTDQKNWDEILPFITHAYNTTIQETTGYSPFFLMFGREPTSLLDDRNISVDIDKDDYDEYIKHHLDKINRTRKLVINNTIKTQERMKKNYDKKHMERSYEPGELVAVWTPIRKIGKCEKLLRKYFGPYRILKKLSNVNYLIEPKDNPGQDPLIVHVSRIKPYFERIDEVNHED